MGLDIEKPHGSYRVSRQRGTQRSRREHNREHERPDAADTWTHMSLELRRRNATKALADQCTQLELDALSHRSQWRPVVSHGSIHFAFKANSVVLIAP